MFCTFTGGPLHGQAIEIDPDKIEDGKYPYYKFGAFKDAFTLAPELIKHEYLIIDNECFYCEPKQII